MTFQVVTWHLQSVIERYQEFRVAFKSTATYEVLYDNRVLPTKRNVFCCLFLLQLRVSFTLLWFPLQNIEWRDVSLLRSRCKWSSRFKVTKETKCWDDVSKRFWQLQTNIQTFVQSPYKPLLRQQESYNIGRDFRTVSLDRMTADAVTKFPFSVMLMALLGRRLLLTIVLKFFLFRVHVYVKWCG